MSNFMKVFENNINELLKTPKDMPRSDLSKMTRDHNALTKDAIVWCKEYLTILNLPGSVSDVNIRVEAYYYLVYMYRSIIDSNLEKQLRNLNSSLLYVKKIIQIIDETDTTEAFNWLCYILKKDPLTEMKYLLIKDLSHNQREQQFVEIIDKIPFVLRFRQFNLK